ncbi:MAG: nuclear transport factor 2 family protein [Gemmatimonadales bacterium]
MPIRLLEARLILTLGLLAAAAPVARAQAAAESAAIRTTALDYAEGWYAGDGDRMARALHPELVKRILVSDTATGRSFVQTMGMSALVNGTRHGYGKGTPADRQQKDVTVLDVFGNAAIAKVVMADWIDYLQLVRVEGHWLIVNVLWERKPAAKG